MSEHPSYLELDRLALGVARSRDAASHVASCDRCRVHVERARATTEPPSWAKELARSRRSRRYAWVPLAAALSLAAVVAVILVALRPQGETTKGLYVASKGAPGVWVFVKRGGEVKPWKEEEPIATGDGLRLKVDGGGFSQVAVFAVPNESSTSSHISRLYTGPTNPKEAALLPVAWTVDDSPGPEVLVVVLSDAPVEVADLVDRRERPGFWVKKIVLPKVAAGVQP